MEEKARIGRGLKYGREKSGIHKPQGGPEHVKKRTRRRARKRSCLLHLRWHLLRQRLIFLIPAHSPRLFFYSPLPPPPPPGLRALESASLSPGPTADSPARSRGSPAPPLLPLLLRLSPNWCVSAKTCCILLSLPHGRRHTRLNSASRNPSTNSEVDRRHAILAVGATPNVRLRLVHVCDCQPMAPRDAFAPICGADQFATPDSALNITADTAPTRR